MKIGIIGPGQIGGALAGHLTQRGHQVKVANSRGPRTLSKVAAETGATPVSVREAVQGVDVVIISIPERSIVDLPADLFAGVPASVVVIDTGNYYPELRDGRIAELDAGTLDSEWVAQRLGRPVVKAFNNIMARSLREGGRPPGTPGRIAQSVAGDSQEARTVALRLIDELGFDGVDAGNLAESWRQQPGTPAYCKDLDRAALTRALAAAERSRVDQYRAEGEAAAKKFYAEQANATRRATG
ncbi:NAD(P)-binding domain-containing protein [Nannocystis sp. SCPEA4]|uniref:NADPH-dependent F420 reductase n=1 Tax=Nannocystis sp. SCPEA4 TaxID=2996787 RepID=UPI0022709557|nr:NAD(P)-binding domain-containing protein [Nannocystis sp. SCPEA4]MCY1054751.1 NAD(P)-binding domain-containing protein [Nannocystis sp. SCPEA4]